MQAADKKKQADKAKSAGKRRKPVRNPVSTGGSHTPRRWSQRVTETSDALDLEKGVFALADPGDIARSLKASAERSNRKKTESFRSAMSMLNFYINRAGKNLSEERRDTLAKAKDELRRVFGK